MERDRKQITKLLYLIVPLVILWSTLCSSFCYELGKHGFENINWHTIFQSNMAGIIITGSLLFYGHQKHKIFSKTELD